MSAPGKLVRSSRWKSGPSKGQRPLGSECCVAAGDSGREAYTAIAWGVNVPETLCDGGFNIWVHNDHATITFTHRRPKADLLLGEGRIVEEFVVRARIVMSLRGLAQFRTTIDQTLQAVAHRSTTRQ